MNKSSPFHLSLYHLPIGAILLQLSFKIVTDGMFLDGLIYAAIANNMAHGIGSFWTPAYTDFSFAPVFHEHPPLAFWLQSLYFRILGDGLFVERLYSLTTMAITFGLIHAIWTQVTELPRASFLPMTLWILVQGVAWTYASNLLENTMTVFVLSSTWLYLISRSRQRVLFVALSGLALCLGFLTKGPTSLFPWVLPGVYWLVQKDKFSRFLADQFLLILATAIPLGFLWSLPEASSEFLNSYFQNQIRNSLESVITVEHRTYIFTKYLELLIVPAVHSGVLLFLAKRLSGKWSVDFYAALPFILVSLAGVIPVMASLKQRAFYINAVFPISSIALALLILPAVIQLFDSKATRIRLKHFSKWTGAAMLVASIAVAIFFWGKPGRENDPIEALHETFSIVPHGSTIGIHKDLNSRHLLHAYFIRYAGIHLNADSADYRFYLGMEPPSAEFRETLHLPPDMILFERDS